MEFETVIGLELHVQLSTDTKLFCGCRSRFGDPPNTLTCPVCLGLPGALPVLNRRAVLMALRMGCAVGSTIPGHSAFARKNYFYPDLPKGYQITQFDLPLCRGGSVPISYNDKRKNIGLDRIHLEEDAGKLVHDKGPHSLVDVNRCGVPLIEIVSRPEIGNSMEAYVFLMEVKSILEYLEICDCSMEEGNLRCDANVSLRLKGRRQLGMKTELKNLNSFHGVKNALDHEIQRQQELLRTGGRIVQETFLWDPALRKLFSMRSKEESSDYRYFPEPDMVPLLVTGDEIDAARESIPELPRNRKERFVSDFKLEEKAAEVLASDKNLADYFEMTVKVLDDPREVAGWITTDILRLVKEMKTRVDRLLVTPQRLGAIIRLVREGAITVKNGRELIVLTQDRDRDPESIISEEGMCQLSDPVLLEETVEKIFSENPEELKRFRAGETKLAGFFIGRIMRATRGRYDPRVINRLFLTISGQRK